jgi:hypothetical protein
MYLEDSGDASVGRRGSSVEQPDTSLADDRVLTSTEATSEQDVASDEENPSGDMDNSGNASDDGSRVIIGAEAARAGVSYDFRQSKVTRAHITSLKNSAHYFPKGFARLPDVESVPDPKENEAIVFKDFFVACLRIPPRPVLLDIMRKFQVQLHQLMPNAIVYISKFVWVVTSCRGRPTADVFAHRYELHYQNKKIHLEGSETTFAAQFVSVSFHPSQFRNCSKLTPTMRNKWTSGWDGN